MVRRRSTVRFRNGAPQELACEARSEAHWTAPILRGGWELLPYWEESGRSCLPGRAGPVGPARACWGAGPRGARLVRRGAAPADCRAAGHARRSAAVSLPPVALARVIPDALRWRRPRLGAPGWQRALHLRYAAGCRPCAAPAPPAAGWPSSCPPTPAMRKGHSPGAPILSRGCSPRQPEGWREASTDRSAAAHGWLFTSGLPDSKAGRRAGPLPRAAATVPGPVLRMAASLWPATRPDRQTATTRTGRQARGARSPRGRSTPRVARWRRSPRARS